jgi:hypothetical protein
MPIQGAISSIQTIGRESDKEEGKMKGNSKLGGDTDSKRG